MQRHINIIINSCGMTEEEIFRDKECLGFNMEIVGLVQESHVFETERFKDFFDILVFCGIFKSKGEARKNWNGRKSVPIGFEQVTVGKLKNSICIWNPFFPPDRYGLDDEFDPHIVDMSVCGNIG